MTGRTQRSAPELLLSAAEGDRRAWEELVDRYAPTLCAVISKYGLAGDDLADVGQATWLRLFGNIGQSRSRRSWPPG